METIPGPVDTTTVIAEPPGNRLVEKLAKENVELRRQLVQAVNDLQEHIL